MKNTDFENLKQFVTEANISNSSNAKIEVLKKFKNDTFIQKVLQYTYSPYTQFRVTSANCLKNSHLVASINNYNSNLFGLLDDLHCAVITGHDAIKAVNAFMKDYPEYSEIFFNIIDKNLKTRIDTTLINKVIPKCIPVFEVALAHSYEESTAKNVKWEDGWYVSRKLDGNRCLGIIDADGNIEIKSRNGKDITTLSKVITELAGLGVRSVVFDGEICVVKDNGDEDFAGIMSVIRKKDYTIENPKFKIFDVIDIDDFINLKGNTLFSTRQENLRNILANYDGSILDIVEQVLIKDQDDLNRWADMATDKGWEGVMIRKNVGYQAGRTKDLLKVKKFKDAEYIVKGVEVGPFRVIKNGVEENEIVLSNILIEHKGCQVSVGSGFSLEERRFYYNNPDQLIGKEVTVKYFEETVNQNGGFSLRFPTVKHIFKDARRKDIE